MKTHTKGRIKRTRHPCPDCGTPMADGGSIGYYCTKPGCDHDTLRGALKSVKQHPNAADFAAERRIRDAIVAVHTLSLVEQSNRYRPIAVRAEDLQALLRLLDRARLNTKVTKL